MRYLPRRLVTYAAVFFAVVNLDFILPRLLPGSAAQLLAAGSKFAPQQEAILMARFGLNQPILVQYEFYLKNIFLTWPPFFGISYQFYPEPVTYLFYERIWWTVLLISVSFVIAVTISYVMVWRASIKRGGRIEMASLYTSITCHSIPAYWTSMVLLWVFGIWLNWLPVIGNVAFNTSSALDYASSVVVHSILPVAAMVLALLGGFFLLLRSSTQEVQKEDFVTAAMLRGLSRSDVSRRYILRNSLLPFISILSFSMATMVSIVILIEAVFAYPGIGDLIVDAITARDYPVLQGSLFFVTIIVIVGGIIGDVVLLRLDPRIRKD